MSRRHRGAPHPHDPGRQGAHGAERELPTASEGPTEPMEPMEPMEPVASEASGDPSLSDAGEAHRAHDLSGAALGALAPEERVALDESVAQDPALQRELDALHATVAELAWLVPPTRVNRGRSAGIRSRLVARAGSSQEGRPPGRGATPIDVAATALPVAGSARREGRAPTPGDAPRARALASVTPRRSPPPPASAPGAPRTPPASAQRVTGPRHSPGRPAHGRGSVIRPLLALAAIVVVAAGIAAGGVQIWRLARERAALQAAVGARVGTLASRVAALRAQLAARDSLIATLTGPQTRVIDLATYTVQGPRARLFWDQRTNQWTMFAQHLRPPDPGRTYQLWLIARGHPAPISAGTFAPDASGSVVMHAHYDMPPGTLQRVAVTQEPAGGVPFPTGAVVVAGQGR